MKIKLKSRWIYGENIMISACPVSEALFELLENRKTLRIKDLVFLGRMGFDIEFVGETFQLANELVSKDIKHHRENERLIYDAAKENKG